MILAIVDLFSLIAVTTASVIGPILAQVFKSWLSRSRDESTEITVAFGKRRLRMKLSDLSRMKVDAEARQVDIEEHEDDSDTQQSSR